MNSGDDSSYDHPEQESGSGDDKDEGGDDESNEGSDPSTDKKPKAVPGKATPPSTPDKSKKAAEAPSPRRTSPRNPMKPPSTFPDSPASTRTPEGKKVASGGSKRKAARGSTGKKKVKAVSKTKTAAGGMIFLKNAVQQGGTRPKKTMRRFAWDVERGIDEAQVRYANAILPGQKLEKGELGDKIEALTQARKGIKDTIKRQIEVKMVEHARRNGLILAFKKNEARAIDHISNIADVWLEAEPDNRVHFLATANLIFEVLLGRFRTAEYAGWKQECERQVMQCHNLSYDDTGLNDEQKAKDGAVFNAVTRVHTEIVKSWRKRATGPKGNKWVLRMRDKEKDASGHAVKDGVSDKGRFRLEYLQKQVRKLPLG
jgi:hypothetical protein